jgi:hemoglobin
MQSSQIRDLNTVTLYEKLGGDAGIRRIVDGAIAAHLRNPVIRARFAPYEDRPDRVEEVKRHTCDFFAAGSGGPDRYRGRSMAEAHRGMNIDAAEYAAASDDILSTMKDLNYDGATRAEVHEILRALEADIVHK